MINTISYWYDDRNEQLPSGWYFRMDEIGLCGPYENEAEVLSAVKEAIAQVQQSK